MIKHIYILTRPCHSGVTLTEYAILIALIGILGVAGLNSLGNSTSGLLQDSTKNMETNNTLSLLAPTKQAQSGSIEQSGQSQALTKRYYKMVTEPKTGAPELQVSNTAYGTGTNVSSADGLQKSSIEVASAARIADLANKETDPATQSYYRRLAELTYWLGGTQGILDNVKPLIDYANKKIGARLYTKKSALTDLLKYQRELQELMQNPPAAMASEDVDAVRPLVENALAISQSYIGKYDYAVTVDATTGNSIVDPTAQYNLASPVMATVDTTLLTPAQKKQRARQKARKDRQVAKMNKRVTERSLGTIMKLPEMEKVASTVVNNQSVTSTAVKTTLKTGTALAEKAAPSTSTDSQSTSTLTKP